MKRTAADVLKEARELLKDEDNWIDEVFARDDGGDEVDPDCSSACQWCAFGAIKAVSHGNLEDEAVIILANAMSAQSFVSGTAAGGFVSRINDASKTTHADLLGWFDRAIAAAAQPQ